MATTSNYRDLLWDFTYQGLSEKHEVTLRVFDSEQDMYMSQGKSNRTFSVQLPIEWSSSRKGSRPGNLSSLSAAMLTNVGRQLWDSIPSAAKAPLLEASDSQPCRLKISSNSPVIDDFPWEWLDDGIDQPFALRAQTRVSRSIPIRLAIPPMRVERPLRVLLVLTNPKDERLLNASKEIYAIRPRLDESPYDLKILEEPRWEALLSTLQESPHIVHYIGHAGVERGEGNLILHDWESRTQWIAGSELAQALPPSVRLLCLSTCFTVRNYQILGLPRLAHAPGTTRLPTTVVNRYAVEEEAVSSFWREFYESLARNMGNVNEAFHDAQRAVSAQPSAPADWGSFSLVIRDQTGEGMRLERGRTRSAEQYGAEIQAQLASQLANDLAERLLGLGSTSADIVQKHYDEAASRASNLAQDLE